MPTTLLPPRARPAPGAPSVGSATALVACPDARPPAYQAVVGLARAGLLAQFETAFYHGGEGLVARLAARVAPARFGRVRRLLRRRHDPEIPRDRVAPRPEIDLALAAENRLGIHWPKLRRAVARARTRRFDRTLARSLARLRPGAALIFSDVGSEFALPLCRRLGITTVLSMVHGDVREECEVLRSEAEAAPDFFPIYLADGPVDRDELRWLHERRLRDLELADRILVPSEHIARTLVRHGTLRDRLRLIPYAADTQRFVPDAGKRHGPSCTFLFAGGLTQRKGIKYLLSAWRGVRRPGWRLRLVGALPGDPGPLRPYLDEVDYLGRVGHDELPAVMAQADVFVFPSLFEGSAVVTYEAMASGLPCVVTPSAGSVARDGVEGFLVPPGDVAALAAAMERLGEDPELRAAMSARARARAEEFGWDRYHREVVGVVREVIGG